MTSSASPTGAADIARFSLQHASHELNSGDTVVFINVTGDSIKYDCSGIAWKPIVVRVSRDNLAKTGSAKLNTKIRPLNQTATKKAESFGLPATGLVGVKWSLDLTPSPEGDDIIYDMSQLSLSRGIIDYWTVTTNFSINEDVAGGHDDVCDCWREKPPAPPAESASVPKAEGEAEGKGKGWSALRPGADAADGPKIDENDRPFRYPAFRRIQDYCPIRHRLSILRLLFIIEGRTIAIDSAPRMWSMMAIGRIFECVDIVRPFIMQWFLASQNHIFVEFLPEESFRIGMDVKICDLTRSAFRVLVAERGLEMAANRIRTPLQDGVTLFGRLKSRIDVDVDDDLETLVQHGAQALIDRINVLVSNFSDAEKIFNAQSEWAKLEVTEQYLMNQRESWKRTDALDALNCLRNALLDQWKHTFFGEQDAAEASDFTFPRTERVLNAFTRPDPHVRLWVLYNNMTPVQKCLCSRFYSKLSGLWYSTSYTMQEPVLNHQPTWKLYNTLIRVLEHFDEPFPLFDLDVFAKQLERMVLEPLQATIIVDTASGVEQVARHLLPDLNQDEYKFLPLWAGGNNDGSGGVFEPLAPPAQLGAVGPGPAYNTGFTVPSTTSTTSLLAADVASLDMDSASTSTAAPSQATAFCGGTVGGNDGKNPARTDTTTSESFNTGDDDQFNDARFHEPVEGQAIAQALEMMMDEDDDTTGQWTEEDFLAEFQCEDDDEDEDDEEDTVMRMADDTDEDVRKK